jgi:hypothetical protein
MCLVLLLVNATALSDAVPRSGNTGASLAPAPIVMRPYSSYDWMAWTSGFTVLFFISVRLFVNGRVVEQFCIRKCQM